MFYRALLLGKCVIRKAVIHSVCGLPLSVKMKKKLFLTADLVSCLEENFA